MHKELECAANALGTDLPNLRMAADFSDNILREIRTELTNAVKSLGDKESLDVVIFGSLARCEATEASDLDHVVAVHAVPDKVMRTRKLLDAVTEVQARVGLATPGRTGMFGSVISAADITERIGLEQDTNANHSRRILLLQESASVFAKELHARLIRAILERYLVDYEQPKKGVPRFLLNDVVRYWRTMAVDYQAKRWESLEPDWGLRYIKLISCRKLAFAGTMASILLTKEASVDYFAAQFEMPALARLAQMESRIEDATKDDLKRVLEIADEFVGLLKSKDFRTEARAVGSLSSTDEKSEFARARKLARELQEHLQRVFFESKLLRDRSIKYLSF